MRLQHCHHHPAWHKNARSDRGCFPVLTGNTQTASAVPPPPKSIRSQSDRIPCSVSLYLITRARSNPKLKLEADMSHHQHPNPMCIALFLHRRAHGAAGRTRMDIQQKMCSKHPKRGTKCERVTMENHGKMIQTFVSTRACTSGWGRLLQGNV